MLTESSSPKATVKDIFNPSPIRHHNETGKLRTFRVDEQSNPAESNTTSVNIYSHFLGFLFFGIAGLTYPYYGSRKMTNADLLIMTVYCAGVCICFGLSTLYEIPQPL